MGTGTLYVVATPIGNLEDISERAIRTLREADLIAAEDTRHSKKLLNHLGIDTPLVSYHEHNERERAVELVEKLIGGQRIALISDAGTPAISDPGRYLVDAAHEGEVDVRVIPGPSAAVAAMAASGLDADRFVFHGFFPRKRNAVRAALDDAVGYPAAHIYYESPKRIAKSLGLIAEALPEIGIVVARELTKVHEEIVRGTAAEVLKLLDEDVRGECVMILDTQSNEHGEENVTDDAIREALCVMMEEESLSQRDAVRRVAEDLGVPKNRVYEIAIEK